MVGLGDSIPGAHTLSTLCPSAQILTEWDNLSSWSLGQLLYSSSVDDMESDNDSMSELSGGDSDLETSYNLLPDNQMDISDVD